MLVLRQKLHIVAPDSHRVLLPEAQQAAVEVQQGVGILLLGRGVDRLVVLVDSKPGRAGGKARVGLRRPLHGRAGVVPRPLLHRPEHLLFGQELGEQPHVVAGHHVGVLLHLRQAEVGHADLLPLVDEGRAPLEQVHGRQHFPALHPVFLAAVAADDPGMVVVFDVQGGPGLALELLLPVGEGFFHLSQAEGAADHVGGQTVGLHVGKADHLVQHLLLPLGHIAQGGLRRGHGALSHGEAVVGVQHLPLEFPQIIMHGGEVGIVFHAVGHGDRREAVRQTLRLGDEGHHILPEAVHPQIQPEAQDILHLPAHLGIGHVQIRLLFGEEMEIVFVQPLVIFPGAALKEAGPVVGGTALAPDGLARAPDVVVVIGVVLPLFALQEPGVLVGAVVHHQIHEDPQSPGVGALQHLLEELQIPVIRVDVFVIRDVVAEVRVGRGIEGGEPDGVHPQALDIVQLGEHAPEIADPVPVAVAEAAGPDLIDRHFLVPLCPCHGSTSCSCDFVLFYHSGSLFATAIRGLSPPVFPESLRKLTKR